VSANGCISYKSAAADQLGTLSPAHTVYQTCLCWTVDNDTIFVVFGGDEKCLS